MLLIMGLSCLSTALSAKIRITYPENEWRVNLIPEVVGEAPGYCVASNLYADGTLISFGLREDGKASMALQFKRDYFKPRESYPVVIGFSSGVEGNLSAFAKNSKTLIIQGRDNDILWRQLEENDMFSYEVDDLTFVYSLDYFSFIRRNLQVCLDKMQTVQDNEALFMETSLRPKKRFDLERFNLFGSDKAIELDTIDINLVNEKVAERGSLFERDYQNQDNSVLQEVVGPDDVVELYKSDIIDRLFATFKDTEFTAETWVNPDIPALPENYIESGIGATKVAVGAAKNVGGLGAMQGVDLEDQAQIQPSVRQESQLDVSSVVAGQPDEKTTLPEVYGALFARAGLTPIAGSVALVEQEDYVLYSWILPNSDDMKLEQIIWPEGYSFADMMANYLERQGVECAQNYESEHAESYHYDAVYVSQGWARCGRTASSSYQAVAFFAVDGNFTTVAAIGDLRDEKRLDNARDQFLLSLLEAGEIPEDEREKTAMDETRPVSPPSGSRISLDDYIQ